ncbi:MAG TPA: cupin domain-containing protein [Candidatus Doudnabacteria bacterium]|nr:cupin domain-containing protein [Candidatus Doudnabacteria bacterium]
MISKNILQQTLDNTDFRRVVFTNEHSQLVLMNLLPGEEIGEETHDLDQMLYFVSGSGKAVFDGEEYEFAAGDVANVPAGLKHNFINSGSEPIKLFTVYSPPEHPDGTVHQTKAEADAAEHH